MVDRNCVVNMESESHGSGNDHDQLDVQSVAASSLEGGRTSNVELGSGQVARLTRFLSRVKNIRKGRVSPVLPDHEVELGSVNEVGDSQSGEGAMELQQPHVSLPSTPIPDIVSGGQVERGITGRNISAGSNASRNRSSRIVSVVRRFQQRRARLSSQGTSRIGFLPYFLAILYYIGISQLQLESAAVPGNCHQFGRTVQLVAFATMSTLTFLKALFNVKQEWFEFRVKKSTLQFISLGYYSSNLATRGSMIHLFRHLGGKTPTLMAKVENIHKNYAGRGSCMRGFKAIPAGLVTLSITASIAQVTFAYYPFNEWSFYKTQSLRAYDAAQSLMVWSTLDFENVTDTLYDRYATNGTTGTYCFAIFGDVLAFTGTLYENILLDIFLILALEVYCLQKILNKTIKDSASGAACPLTMHWNLYMQCRNVCDLIDETFGPLLKLIHFRNMFFFANLLLHLMTTDTIDIWLVVACYSIVRILLAYYFSWKTSAENHTLEVSLVEYWKDHNQMDINGHTVNVQGVLHDMKLKPIGIGREEFYINETFLLKLIGAVGTMFMFLSDAKDKESFKVTY